ncbi:MAG: SRPBCC family protein [Blastocatellia bacterium]
MKTETQKTNTEKKAEGNTSPGTVRLHRVFAAKPEKVYRAFTSAEALARWLPPDGFTCAVHEMNAKVGGTYRMSFTNFTTGNSHSFGGKFVELKPNEFLRYTDSFDDPNLPGEMMTTVSIKPVSVGSEVSIIQEGIPAAIPEEACYMGWQQSLSHLAKLVEPEIRD